MQSRSLFRYPNIASLAIDSPELTGDGKSLFKNEKRWRLSPMTGTDAGRGAQQKRNDPKPTRSSELRLRHFLILNSL